jgi:phosphohistidine swiveling domain-containing protein
MKTTRATGNDVAAAAKRFNDRRWLKQGTWPGKLLWFAPILESFSAEWTGRVLEPRLEIRDYACIGGLGKTAYDCLIGDSCFADVRGAMEENHRRDGTAYFHDYSRRCEETVATWVEFSETIHDRAESLDTLSNAEVGGLLHQYFVQMRENGSFMDTIIVLADLLGDVVGREVEGFLAMHGVEDPGAYGIFLDVHMPAPRKTNIALAEASLRVLIASVRASGAEELFLTESPQKIMERSRRSDPSLVRAIEEHIARFGWLNTYSFSGHPFTAEEIVTFVQEALGEPIDARPAVDKSSPLRDRIASLTLPSSVADLLLATSRLAYINTAKDDAHQLTWQNIQPLIATIMRRLQCTRDELTLCLPGELETALTTLSLDRDSIARRQDGWTLLKTGDELTIIEGAADVEHFRGRSKSFLPFDTPILHGRPIVAGLVRGRARVVLTASDGNRVETGDILVATNTNPDFIPAMRRAAAFVTDTGNLICHAVIAAREFRKPCVIATQIATQVIAEGEWLEVDGTTGIVRRLDKEAV